MPAPLALDIQTGSALRLGERKARSGRIAKESLPSLPPLRKYWGCRNGEVLAGVWNLPLIDLCAHPPDEASCDANDIDLYLAHLFLPWRRVGGVPVIVCADITSETRRAIAMRYGPRAVVAVTSKADIVDTVQRLFHRTLTHDGHCHINSAGL